MTESVSPKGSEVPASPACSEVEAILACLSDACFTLDRHWRFVAVNRAAESLLGEERNYLVGREIWSEFPEFSGTAIEERCRAALDQGTPVEMAYRDPVLLTHLQLRATPHPEGLAVRIDSGTATGQNGPTRSRHESRDLPGPTAWRLEPDTLRLQRLESLGTLATGIAHDLNNMLTPVMLSTDLLRTEVRSDEGLEALETIELSAHHGANLVRRVLDFARGMDSDQRSITAEALIDGIHRIVADAFPKQIRFEIPATPPGTWTLLGNPTQLHQMLLNLCLNARDAMPTGGELVVTTRNFHVDDLYAHMHGRLNPGDYVLFTVRDTGHGFTPEIGTQIFDPFFTTRQHTGGTGLGLATARAIVESHEGVIQHESVPGRGTVFEIYLPASREIPDTEPAQRASPLPCGCGETVMVVDDEESVRAINRHTLEAFGYRVLTAANGAEALRGFGAHGNQVDVVLTNITMPVMDGLATIRALLHLDPDLPIVAVTGLGADAGHDRARDAGARHTLPKPYDAETLLRLVHRVLDESPQNRAATA